MQIIYNSKTLKHNKWWTPEWDYRLKWIEKIWTEVVNIDYDLAKIWIIKVHWERYFNKIKKAFSLKQEIAEIKTNNDSFEASLISVYLSILSAKKWYYAAIRPPWHHAEKEKPMWFCFFNNIAIATQYLLDEWKKVCIIDIDWHHWNWTEKIFYKNNNVLYISIHQEDSFPNTWLSSRIWEWQWKWFNVNIPILKNSWDEEFILELEKIKDKIILFNPDIIWVSAWFDWYYKDELLNLKITLNWYKKIGEFIKSFNKKTFAVLEWGYHKDLVKCIENFCEWIKS